MSPSVSANHYRYLLTLGSVPALLAVCDKRAPALKISDIRNRKLGVLFRYWRKIFLTNSSLFRYRTSYG
jgi:hypothetical protein